jgi:ERCC4-type nuclease
VLLIDDRIGSKDLLRPLQLFGVPAELMRLEFGDFAFIGRGEGGRPIHVGVELKETRDLIKSLETKRIAGHQLGGLLTTYDRPWLLTEGIWRANDDGVLEVFSGGWRPASVGPRHIMARELDAQILTLCIRGGISHHHCSTRTDTIRWLSVLYHWWCDKNMDAHKSHLAFHQPDLDRALLETPSFTRRVAKELPGIGWEKSRVVEEFFGGSVRRMACAPMQQWTQIPGIGPKIASAVVAAFEGDPNDTREK